MYEVEVLEFAVIEDLANLLELFKRIKTRPCTVDEFLDYLNIAWPQIKVFVVREDGDIVGFTIAEHPSILERKAGWLLFAYMLPEVSHSEVKKCYDMTMDWLKSKGADKCYQRSIRKPNALKRIYGITPSKEVLYEKCI